MWLENFTIIKANFFPGGLAEIFVVKISLAHSAGRPFIPRVIFSASARETQMLLIDAFTDASIDAFISTH
jgi:hypothetical protein